MKNATLKGLRRGLESKQAAQPLQGCEGFVFDVDDPGLQQPWAEVSQRFQRSSPSH